MVCGLADLGQLDSRGNKVADFLLVIDMQSDYVAVGKAYHEELTAAVNDKIASYPSDRVIYILNRFFWERKDRKKKFATGLLLYLLVSLRSVGLLALPIQI